MSQIAALFAAERIESDDPLEGLAEAERRPGSWDGYWRRQLASWSSGGGQTTVYLARQGSDIVWRRGGAERTVRKTE